ncbi:rhodopsin, GQ-coupled-like [Biomphalaria glabrata]|uniref:Rhodopsin, GQ-coupled-like n=1 Tax=Biomphalaria glabrata TaxID=6526 RepID=A0A9W2ZDS6_BIOGL|nr:rhodopsin, GQ-coupled-like [Biomphalaria glabrata]
MMYTTEINVSTLSINASFDKYCFETDLSSLDVNSLGRVFNIIINIILALTCAFNSLTLLVLIKSPDLRNYRNAVSICQVVTDTFFPFSFAITYLAKPILSTALVFNFIAIWFNNLSYAWMILISAQRYVTITHPSLHRRLFTKVNVYTAIIFVWLTSFFLSHPFGPCNDFSLNISHYSMDYHLYVFPVIHCLCLILLSFIYIHIFIIVRRHLCHIATVNVSIDDSDTQRRNQRRLNRQKRKSVFFFLSVLVLYFVLITPNVVGKLLILKFKYFRSENYYIYSFVLQLLYSLAPSINFYLFTCKCPGFFKSAQKEYQNLKKSLLKCFASKCCHNEREERDTFELTELNR